MEWIEFLADNFVWLVPILAVGGLWLARSAMSDLERVWAERTYFAFLLIVACGTLRTILVDDPGWLLHTASLGLMIVGGILPTSALVPLEPSEL
jgi:hypothetical protein